MRHILAWIGTVEVIGLAALPILRSFFRNRRDAALLSRPLGLALVAFVAWGFSLPGLPFGRGLLLFGLLLVAMLSTVAHRRGPERGSQFWGKEETRAAILFWAAAGVFLLIRAAAPGIYGQEKYMDLAFLNSLTRNDAMPPLDPWMAGKTINYYYWGYLLAASLAKLSGVTTFISYNLAVATFAGYSFVAAVCLGLRLSAGRLAAGLGAGLATVFAGNLQGALDAWEAPFDKGFDYFHASRVIGGDKTINEFPFFTFFHADLHPHLLAFPYFLAAFAAAHIFIERGRLARGEAGSGAKGFLPRRAAPALLLALTAGTAMAANKWNTPAMGILLVFTGALRQTEGRRLPTARELLRGAAFGAFLFLLALLLFLPYSLSYGLPNNGLGRTHETSGFLEFLGVWGILLAVAYAALLLLKERDGANARGGLFLTGVVALSWLLALLWSQTPWKMPMPVLALLLPLAYLAARAGRDALRQEDGPLAFASFLLLLAVAIIVGCELIHFKDSYGQDLHRMNTIFKFYLQAWPLLAVAAAVLAERAWRAGGRGSRAFRAVLTLAAFLALLYPLNATVSRFRQSEGAPSLDARAPFERRAPADAAAVAFLEKNAPRGSVVMEATGNPYSDYARISSHTGIPTVLGWGNHEGLWRGNDPEVAERERAVRAFYEAPDPPSAYAILKRFGVTHVVVGPLEETSNPNAADVIYYPFMRGVHPGETLVFLVLSGTP